MCFCVDVCLLCVIFLSMYGTAVCTCLKKCARLKFIVKYISIITSDKHVWLLTGSVQHVHLHACRYILKLMGCRFSITYFYCLMVVKKKKKNMKSTFLTVFLWCTAESGFLNYENSICKKKQNEWFCVYELQTCENMHIIWPLSCHSGVLVIFWWLMKTGKIQRSLLCLFFFLYLSATLCPLIAECLNLLSVDMWTVKHMQIPVLQS